MLLVLTILTVTIGTMDGQSSSLDYTHRLPGLDAVESGFDMINMMPKTDSESRFRIFDFSGDGAKQFKFSVLGQEDIYNIPDQVKVSDVSKYREVNCEDLSSDYRHFYSK